MRLKLSTVFLLVGFYSQYSFAIRANIFDMNDNTKKIFTLHRVDTTKENERSFVTKYYSLDGQLVVQEEGLFKNNKLYSFRRDHKQLKSTGKIEIKNNKVHFEYTVDGKTKTDDEELEENFIIGPSMQMYLQTKWSDIMSGKTVKTRFAVLDRRETVGFKFFKTKDFIFNGQDAVELKMKPSSFIISALVDPLYIIFAKDGSEILAFKGRIVPKELRDGKYKDLDAYTVFEKDPKNVDPKK